MPVPTGLAYQYEQTSIIAEWPASHGKALEIAHREFVELRNVQDEHIHFCMFIKRHSETVMKSRISPTIWEGFFQGFVATPDRLMVMYVEVEKPRKSGWAERLRLGREKGKGKSEMLGAGEVPVKKDEDRDVAAIENDSELPAYSKEKV
ncbi:unnamed protein product [Peniophora sp. CBMAI 1063]|nr:unnamed protein product [Peniophora sp. CBMAI 1063]